MMKGLLRALFSFSGTMGRGAYVGIALSGVLVKHAADLYVATQLFHREWSPLNYLLPLGLAVPFNATTLADRQFLAVMLAVALPFAWIGLAITAKRFRTIGWPAWCVLLFFVPIANVVSFAIASVWPQGSPREGGPTPRWIERIVPSDSWGAALLSVVVSALIGVVLVDAGTRMMSEYGWGLFAAVPFSQGAIAAALNGVHQRRTLVQSAGVALLSVGLTLAALLAVALEGAICVAMAAPLALGIGVIGSFFGHALQDRDRGLRVNPAALLVLLLAAPAVMGAEAIVPRNAPVYVVESAIDIDATPAVVWKNVVTFPDLQPPVEPIFKLGVAYPVRARIAGHGVGATRYCEFSTGDFIEPITAWEPGKRLAFRVAKSAEPMRELSPYPGLDTAHLHGYMVSLQGEFDLVPLPGGRTKLIGRTWYMHHLWPATYWAVYSNEIVHLIHLRVLDHIKRLSETAVASASTPKTTPRYQR